LHCPVSGLHVIPFLIPNEIGAENTLRARKYNFCVIVIFDKFLVNVYYNYTASMCAAFGVLKIVNISNNLKR